jgi:hypothetical protein
MIRWIDGSSWSYANWGPEEPNRGLWYNSFNINMTENVYGNTTEYFNKPYYVYVINGKWNDHSSLANSVQAEDMIFPTSYVCEIEMQE